MTLIPDSPVASAFVLAANFTRVTTPRAVGWLVVHTAETPEGPKTARNVAAYFALKTTQASAHYSVDSLGIIQSVRELDIAWQAPGLNSRSIGIEHAGRASQTLAQWQDPYSTAMLRLSARLFADLARRYTIPVRYVDAAGLLRGDKGITTHAQVTKAFKRSTHTDPGPNFPMATFINLVKKA